MARPLKINNTTPKSLKEMSDAEIDYLSYVILTDFAASSTGTGTLSTDNTKTSIGSITDTERTAPVGTHPISGFAAATSRYYQDLTAVTISGTTRPLKIDSGTSPASMKEMSDSDINTTIISQTAAQMVTGDIGSYRFATSLPTGGTWTSTGIKWIDYNVGGDTTYTLYRKTNATAPSTVRSIKSNSGSLKEMSDTEIKTLTQYLRKYIVDTGIGKYSLTSTAPATGTWVDVGSMTDTRKTLVDTGYVGTVNYLGNYVHNYAGNYTGNYTGTYTRTSVRSSTRTSTRTSARQVGYLGVAQYAGNYLGDYVHNYVGNYARVGNNAGNFLGTSTTNFQRTSTRTSLGYYTGDFVGNFLHNYARSGGVTSTTDVTRNYTRTSTREYYAGNYVGNYVGNYARVGTDFTIAGNFLVTSTRTSVRQIPAYYVGNANYTGNYAGNFSGNYVGNYDGAYTRTSTRTSTRTFSANYSREVSYAGLTVSNTNETNSTTTLWLRTA